MGQSPTPFARVFGAAVGARFTKVGGRGGAKWKRARGANLHTCRKGLNYRAPKRECMAHYRHTHSER